MSDDAADRSSDTAVSETEPPKRPLERVQGLALQEVQISDDLRHVELYTLGGLLGLLWHGDRKARDVVLCCGGAMGGLLGPADGLYHELGVELAPRGVGVVRVDYRQPNALDECVLDLGVAAELAILAGAERFVVMGHSFGGAVAVNAAGAMRRHVAGVVTLATQSAGCETAGKLAGLPLLLIHGDSDELLPLQASQVVQALAGGTGELMPLAGAGHLLREARDEVRSRLLEWIPDCMSAHAKSGSEQP